MLKIIFTGASLAVLASGHAMAADPYIPPPVMAPIEEAAPEAHVSDSFTGWYIRGDIGYNFTNMHGARYLVSGGAGEANFDWTKIASNATFGGGVGYQVNNYLRGDLTVDYMGRSNFNGQTTGSCGVSATCTSVDTSSFTALSLMANAYVDLGTYGRFTPYVGAGIGGTYINWASLNNTACETGNPTNCDPTTIHGGYKNWRYTWSLMAGASVDITCGLKADVGYRYRKIEKGYMFHYANSAGPGFDKGMSTHEVRAGLRYNIGERCSEPEYIPPPLPPVYK